MAKKAGSGLFKGYINYRKTKGNDQNLKTYHFNKIDEEELEILEKKFKNPNEYVSYGTNKIELPKEDKND